MTVDRRGHGSVKVRRAEAADEAILLSGRNDPEMVQRALSRRAVTPAEHHRWFQETLAGSMRELFLIEVGGSPAGMVRYDIQPPEQAEISIYLLPPHAGQGYGREAFFATAPGVLTSRGLKRIRARVRKDNPGSRRFFLRLGFLEDTKSTDASAEVHELSFECPHVPNSRPWIGEPEAATVPVVTCQHGAGGDPVRQLERRWREQIRTLGAVAVGSGLAALRLAMLACGVGPGSEAVLPAYSCMALLNAVLSMGAVPILADVTADCWTISPDDVRQRLTPRTKAIMAVHLFGAPAPVGELLKLGIPVIEDCAHGIGGFSDGGIFGAAGTLSVSSFDTTELIWAGRGGMVAGQDSALLDRVRQTRDHGEELPDGRFLDDKMADVDAASTLVQLDRLGTILMLQREKAQTYETRLAGLATQGTIVLPPSLPGRIWYRYAVRLCARSARETAGAMAARGIGAKQPIRDLRGCPCWHDGLPGGELAFDRILSLPLYPNLSDTDQLFVSAALEVCR